MKKSDALRVKTRKMIAKNLIVLVVLLIVAFAGTFSWFKSDPNASAYGISAKARVVNGLEYYIVEPSNNDQYYDINTKLANYAAINAQHANEQDYVPINDQWHKGEISFDFTTPEFQFLENLFMDEVTSDGVNFKIPKLLQYGDVAVVDTAASSVFSDAVPNRDYLSFDIYFRSKTDYQLDLKSTTTLAPAESVINNTEAGMKNAAIGAVRMSVLNNKVPSMSLQG